jgi:hypothetical protein
VKCTSYEAPHYAAFSSFPPVFFPLVLPAKYIYAFLMSPLRDLYLEHQTVLDLPTPDSYLVKSTNHKAHFSKEPEGDYLINELLVIAINVHFIYRI